MKILNVIMSMDEKTGGGTTERVRQLSLHLNKLGHKVTILTTNYNLSKRPAFLPKNIEFLPLPCIIPRYYLPFPFLWKVSQVVKNADIIHLVNHWTIINVIAFIFITIYKKPYVVSPLGSLPIYGRSKLIKKFYNSLIGKRIINRANACVVTTNNEYPSFQSLGVNKSKLNHIPNGIDEKDYLFKGDDFIKEKLGLGNNPFVLFIGRLNPIKGPDLLLNAFCKIKNKLPNLDLVFIGPDEGMLKSLNEFSVQNSLNDRVHFLGFLSRDDKSRLLHASSFLSIPSRQEAMSIVVLESGIAEKPVLITDQCGFDEVEGVGGGFVVSATIDALAEGIKKMMSKKNIMEKMGKNLNTFVKKRYLWETIANDYNMLFERVVSAK